MLRGVGRGRFTGGLSRRPSTGYQHALRGLHRRRRRRVRRRRGVAAPRADRRRPIRRGVGGDWISIAVDDETQWRQLCHELDATALVDDPRYATLADRLEHTDVLDLDIAKLTRSHDAGQLSQRLRTAGVPAAKSATALDIISDQLLWDRELYRFVSDHRDGQRPVLAAPWRMSAVEAEIVRGAPDLGEHDDYVLDEILRAHAMEGT